MIVGRREHRHNKLGADRLRDLKKENIHVLSYDRVAENYHGQATYYRNIRRDAESLVGPGEKLVDLIGQDDTEPSS